MKRITSLILALVMTAALLAGCGGDSSTADTADVLGTEFDTEKRMTVLTYEDVKGNAAIRTYIQRADESLTALGFTEHSFAHVTAVAEKAGYILETLGYPARTVELVKIAGFLHDIGNLVNRVDHSQSAGYDGGGGRSLRCHYAGAGRQ